MKRFTIPVEDISLSSISLHDTKYKISKPEPTDTLKKSVLQYGVIEPLLLMYCGGYYTLLTGHNRAALLKDANVISVPARIIESFQPDIFLEYGLLKNFHEELGPVGKLKLFDLIEKAINTNAVIKEQCRSNLSMPPELTCNPDLRNKILDFPSPLLHYIDIKDIKFRTIIDLAGEQDELLQILSAWVEQIPMRVNIFKSITDMISDIRKRDTNIDRLREINIEAIQDRRMKELYLVENLRQIRYPEYSELKLRASNIINDIEKSGISVSIPDYFEGDTVSVVFNVSRREGIQKLQDQVQKLNFNKVKELLDLL
jgi:hypothetical protein